MYAWILARERNERAWAQPRALRVHAHTVACAYAREFGRSDPDGPGAAIAWQEIYLDQPADQSGHFEWTLAEGPKESAYLNMESEAF